MWHNTKLVFAGSIVTFSLSMTLASSFAQDTTRDAIGARTTTTRDNNDGFNLGWIGLAGLAGLVGLMPRDRGVRHDQNIKT